MIDKRKRGTCGSHTRTSGRPTLQGVGSKLHDAQRRSQIAHWDAGLLRHTFQHPHHHDNVGALASSVAPDLIDKREIDPLHTINTHSVPYFYTVHHVSTTFHIIMHPLAIVSVEYTRKFSAYLLTKVLASDWGGVCQLSRQNPPGLWYDKKKG